MKQTLLLVVLSLCCLSLTSYADACNPDGPGNCTRWVRRQSSNHDADCSWSSGKTDVFQILLQWVRFWFVSQAVERKITSRQACSTGGQAHCLWFWYSFERNDGITLSVTIKYEGGFKTTLRVVSSSDGWTNASVDINTTSRFTVVFTASGSPTSKSAVFLDDISYSKSPCRPEQTPPNAPPTSDTSTALVLTSTTSTTSIKDDTTAGIISENSNARTPVTPSGSTEAVTTLTIPGSDHDKPVPPSNRAGIIAGVTVAGLLVIVIAVLLVVFRRKCLRFRKTFLKNKQQTEVVQMNASNNAAHGLGADDPSHSNSSLTNCTPQNSKNHEMEVRASTYSTGEYSVTRTTEPVYARVNKPITNRRETPFRGPKKVDTAVYEVSDENEMRSSTCQRADSQDHSSAANESGQDGHECSSASMFRVTGDPQEENRVYHILEKIPETESDNVYHVPQGDATTMPQEQDGDYNRLDFDMKNGVDGKSRVAAIGSNEEKSEISTGGVYCHLNEGGEDTYNEVHRQKRTEVIDGVYSHIK